MQCHNNVEETVGRAKAVVQVMPLSRHKHALAAKVAAENRVACSRNQVLQREPATRAKLGEGI
jgi:hypothetical protein